MSDAVRRNRFTLLPSSRLMSEAASMEQRISLHSMQSLALSEAQSPSCLPRDCSNVQERGVCIIEASNLNATIFHKAKRH